jgi:GrpB-like predicted nucleotidyltransferase (UPF0157 family)
MQRSRASRPGIAVVPYDLRWPQEFERAVLEILPIQGTAPHSHGDRPES